MKSRNVIILFAAFIILGISACTEKHDTAFDGYLYPYDSLISPKVFVYKRTDTVDTYFYRFKQVITENGKKFLITTSMGKGAMKDSSKNLIIGEIAEPIELYIYMNDKSKSTVALTKGIINKYKNSDKLKVLDVIYKNPFNESSSQVKIESSFNSFITMKYRDKNYNCVLFEDVYKIKIKYKNIPLSGNSFSLKYKSVLAKGLGMIQYSLYDKKNDREYVWELDSIVDYHKFLEKTASK